MTQMALYEAAEDAKQEGMGAALAGADPRWKAAFIEQATVLAKRQEPFTSEDITAVVGLPNIIGANRNNAVGAAMNTVARRGIMQRTGRYVKCKQVHAHARHLSEWIGVA